MPYATQADMEANFSVADLISLTDRDEPAAGVVDTTVLEAALASASRIMDGYFSRKYTTPLATPSLDVVIRCVHIAYYLLHRDSAPDKVMRDYNTALAWLRDVSDGRVRLDGAQAVAPASEGDGVAYGSPGRTFSRDSFDQGGF